MTASPKETNLDKNAVRVTPAAKGKLFEKRQEQDNPDLCLRITVEAGGCSGFQYHFSLDVQVSDSDQLFGECVVIDGVSLAFLKGAEIDYVEELVGSDFKINNPNALSGCGCGTSFFMDPEKI